jgi:hypothetical protein
MTESSVRSQAEIQERKELMAARMAVRSFADIFNVILDPDTETRVVDLSVIALVSGSKARWRIFALSSEPKSISITASPPSTIESNTISLAIRSP